MLKTYTIIYFSQTFQQALAKLCAADSLAEAKNSRSIDWGDVVGDVTVKVASERDKEKFRFATPFTLSGYPAFTNDGFRGNHIDKDYKKPVKKRTTKKSKTTNKMAYAKTTYRKKKTTAKVPARIYSKLSAKSKNEIKRVIAGKPVRKKKRVSKGLFGLGFLGL